ncbi:MAG TPA: hypothetical protein VF092_12285 [Longimicrobium sp.]
MGEPSAFNEALRRITRELCGAPLTHVVLNRASSEIDQLGRRLHGLGYARSREIADCFTAALADLDASHALPEETRAQAVRRATARLDDALAHAAAGVLPVPP